MPELTYYANLYAFYASPLIIGSYASIKVTCTTDANSPNTPFLLFVILVQITLFIQGFNIYSGLRFFYDGDCIRRRAYLVLIQHRRQLDSTLSSTTLAST